MAKSSAPLLVLIALARPGPGEAQTADPQAIVDAQRDQVRGMIRPRCSTDPEEITVCGRRDGRGPRGPLSVIPYAPDPGTIPPGARAGGEQRAAMANDGCIRLCSRPVQINILGIGAHGVSGAARAIGEAIENLSDD